MTIHYRETNRKSRILPINTFSRAVQICSGMVAGFGTIALLGWALDFQLLASIYSAYIPMAPNTATAFVVLGITLFVLARWPTNHISRWVAKVTAIFVLLIGFRYDTCGLHVSHYGCKLFSGWFFIFQLPQASPRRLSEN